MKKLLLLTLICLSGFLAHADIKLTVMPSTCEEGNKDYPFIQSTELGKEFVLKDSDFNLDNGTRLGRSADTENGSVSFEILRSDRAMKILLTYVPRDQHKPRLQMIWNPGDVTKMTTIVSGSACESQRDVGSDSIGLILQKVEAAQP